MKFNILYLFLFTLPFSLLAQDNDENLIDTTLNQWHKAASDADFDTYFNLMTTDAIFIGTDATENWNIEAFKTFSKPYFDAGKAWSFTTIERNIYLNTSYETIAWFDEHLSTQMGVCRGSGIMKKVNNKWKIQHYVLSIAVPNENVTTLTQLKKEWDTRFIKENGK